MSTHVVRVGVQVIARREGRLVMVERARGFGAGTWCLPGGHLEPGETIIECALRELEEETGVVGFQPRVVLVTDPDPNTNHHMQIGVEVTGWTGDLRVVDPSECAAVELCDPDRADRDVFVASRHVLAAIRSGDYLPG